MVFNIINSFMIFMNINIFTRKINFIILYFISLIFIGFFINIFENNSYDNDWNIGEWLISYSGGFVRRGLFGELILKISLITQKNPILFVQLISTAAYLIFLYLLKFTRKYFSILFLLSPIVCLAPILGNFLIRKDVFGIILFACCTLIIGKKKDFKNFFLINFISSIAILNHESYIFYALPSLFILNIFSNKLFSDKRQISLILESLTFLLPSLFCIFLVTYFRGSPEIAYEIHKGWQNLSEILPSKGSLFEDNPTGAIQTIGWNFENALILLKQVLDGTTSYRPIWNPAAWLYTIFIVSQIFIGEGLEDFKKIKANILLIQFASISPLFILGWDYGRWIFLWVSSSLFFCSSLIEISKGDQLLISKFENIAPNFLLSKMNGIILKGKWQIIYLFISIPVCMWSLKKVFLGSPALYLFKILG